MLIALEVVGHLPVGIPDMLHRRCPKLKRACRRSLARRCNSEGSYAILAKWPHT